MKKRSKIKLSLAILALICGVFATFFYWPKTSTTPSPGQILVARPKPVIFETFERQANHIKHHPSTSQELKNISLHPRIQASDLRKNPLKRADRFLRGTDLERFSDEKVYLPTVNTPAADWKEKLGHELLRFQPEGVKIAFVHEQSFLSISGGKGRYMELIVVNYINPVNGNTAFRALADSETGQLIDTWDQTHSERVTPLKFSQHKD